MIFFTIYNDEYFNALKRFLKKTEYNITKDVKYLFRLKK